MMFLLSTRAQIFLLFFILILDSTSIAQITNNTEDLKILNSIIKKEIASFEVKERRSDALLKSHLDRVYNNAVAARKARLDYILELKREQNDIINKILFEYGYHNPDLKYEGDYNVVFDMPLQTAIDYLDKEVIKLKNNISEINYKYRLILLGKKAATSLDPHNFLEYRKMYDNRNNYESHKKYIAARYSFISELYPKLKNQKELIKYFSIGFNSYANNYRNAEKMRSLLNYRDR